MAFNWRKFPWTNLHDLNLDWIIQTVKTLEENLADAVSTFQEMINKAISSTLTGSGDLTINKTGDVNITGNNVRITSGSNAQVIGGAFISDGAQQLVMHNPNSSTNMTANYNNGVLTLTNNQQLANGVAVYPINTPADGGGDNSDFAANVGYVKAAVEAVSNALATETGNRTSGDATLQSTIDSVIMPLITALQKRAPRVFYFENDTTTNTTQFMTAEDSAAYKDAIVNHTPMMLIAKTQGALYCYLPVDCSPFPTTENINDPNTNFSYTFQTANNVYRAMVGGAVGGNNAIAVFQTIS